MTNTAEFNNEIGILVVAAGRGMRAGGGIPKQYRTLAGEPVLRRTIKALQTAVPGAVITCVIHPDDISLYEQSVAGLDGLTLPVHGGKERQESVYLGLKAIKSQDTKPAPKYILVHDAARPFVTNAVTEPVIQALRSGAPAVIPGLPVTDTIKSVDNCDTVNGTIDRTPLRAVQTPQGFDFMALLSAHEQHQSQSMTDDAAAIEAAGGKTIITNGSSDNFKLTTAEDFQAAELKIMSNLMDIRVGQGYDVHRFAKGDHVWLGGVKIPHTQTLKGHSDADVALHALTDALLAAIADGDIGTHFPPTDDRWRGAASDQFLKFAANRVQEKSGMIAHLALIIICEAPKIGPHREAIQNRISEITGVPVSRISIQATTTEKLGFTGRKEGISAQATATVRLPFTEDLS